jgi:hypothetical protein
VPTGAACLRPDDLERHVRDLGARFPGTLRVEEAGRSAEGRPVLVMTLGRGPRTAMLWSQMHGDEPSATPALLDAAAYLLSRPDDPPSRRILDALTIVMVPMVNPDGAFRYQRANAQGIDVNRDALSLATPEGRLLKAVRDRTRPVLGFNLHDQNRRTTVGDTGRLATISLLAVAGDPQGTMSEGRWRAKRVAAALVAALEPLVPGGVGRYDEDWSPRAFGDNFTAWGTPVVLVESGGLAEGRPLDALTRLNFVAILAGLGALADDDARSFDPAVYDALARNDTGAWGDVVLRGARVWQGGALAPYRADVAFDVFAPDAERFGCAPPVASGSRVVELGDARFLGAGRAIDVSGRVLAPAFAASVRGLGARDWLGVPVLRALARLGVAIVRWHVADAERGAALRAAEGWPGPGRARVIVVAETDPASPLVAAGPPREPRTSTLGGHLDAFAPGWAGALTRGGWAGLLRAAAPSGPDANGIARDGAADLLVLRPSGERVDERAIVETAWIDGRDVTATR